MKRAFADIATTMDQLSGRPLTFAVALLIIATWALSGPLFNFSDTWQLIINTSTTIITFLMVFVIQNTQNRDGAAIQRRAAIRCCRSNGITGTLRKPQRRPVLLWKFRP